MATHAFAICTSDEADQLIEDVKFNDQGLVPVIAQDIEDGDVLMMAYMNRESLHITLTSGLAVYWSRSRQQLWRKGERSGNTQEIEGIRLDCDGDTILLTVKQHGDIACHTGRRSCFYRTLHNNKAVEWRDTLPIIRSEEDMYEN